MPKSAEIWVGLIAVGLFAGAAKWLHYRYEDAVLGALSRLKAPREPKPVPKGKPK